MVSINYDYRTKNPDFTRIIQHNTHKSNQEKKRAHQKIKWVMGGKCPKTLYPSEEEMEWRSREYPAGIIALY